MHTEGNKLSNNIDVLCVFMVVEVIRNPWYFARLFFNDASHWSYKKTMKNRLFDKIFGIESI